MRRMTIGLCIVVFLLCVPGCGATGKSATVKVTGKVTYKGQPLSGVNVVFTPEKGRPATGTTDSEGRFTLSTDRPGDGAVPGRHTVTITTGAGAPPPMPGTPEAARAAAAKPPFPARYSDPKRSGLTATVEPGGKNDFSFNLTD